MTFKLNVMDCILEQCHFQNYFSTISLEIMAIPHEKEWGSLLPAIFHFMKSNAISNQQYLLSHNGNTLPYFLPETHYLHSYYMIKLHPKKYSLFLQYLVKNGYTRFWIYLIEN